MTYSTKSTLFVASVYILFLLLALFIWKETELTPRLEKAAPMYWEVQSRYFADQVQKRDDLWTRRVLSWRHAHLPDGGCVGLGCSYKEVVP